MRRDGDRPGPNETGDEKQPAGPVLPRREFLRATVIGAVGVSIAGCPADPGMLVPDTGGGSDGGDGRPDAPGGADAPLAPDAGPDAAVEPVVPPEGTPEVPASFPLGVASGDATTAAAICWTQYTGAASLELVVWEMDLAAGTYARTAFRGPATAVETYVHLEATGLSADAAHRFAFFELDASGGRVARSAIGRFRTAPLPDALVPLRIGAVSCISNTRGIETIAHAGARDDLALFAFLGDSTYNDGARSLAQYRDAWISNVGRPEYRALRASTSALATWDDHEFDNNFDPEGFDAAQRTAAVRAFFDHQPLRRDAASPDRVWKSLRWGATLEVFVLDCRNERRPSTRMTPAAEYVSRAQMDWLKAGLVASTAVFKLILNSVPITDFPGLFDVQAVDRWEGYPAQRAEILSHIETQGIRGVLWVAGDFHLASSERIATSGVGASQVEVLVGPGAQTGNVLAATLGGPQFDFATGDNNYAVIDLDPTTVGARVTWVRGNGAIIQSILHDLS